MARSHKMCVPCGEIKKTCQIKIHLTVWNCFYYYYFIVFKHYTEKAHQNFKKRKRKKKKKEFFFFLTIQRDRFTLKIRYIN